MSGKMSGICLGDAWEHIKPLGRGSFGTVHLYRHVPSQAKYAVKFVERGELTDNVIMKEVTNHCMLCHENIAKFREVILCGKYLAIVMEYADGGDLFQAVQESKSQRMNEAMARYFFQQLIAGLSYVHAQGMCHRDLKLENLLLSGNPPKLKICDFGYSKSLKWQSKAKSKVGTAAYIAPEVITAQRGSNYNGNAVDVWSSGVVLHTMLAGMYPFCDPHMPNDEVRTVKRIMAYTKGEAQYTPPDSVHGEGAALLKGMLVPAPEARVSLEQVLASNWFKMNLPRDFSPSKPTEPDPAFPQQSLAEVMVILERAVAMTDDVAAAQASGGGSGEGSGGSAGGEGPPTCAECCDGMTTAGSLPMPPHLRDLKRGDSSKSDWSDASDLEFVEGDELLTGAFDSMQMQESQESLMAHNDKPGNGNGNATDQGESLETLASRGSMPLL